METIITGFTIQPKHGKDGNGYLYSDMYDVELGVQKSKYGVGIIDYLGEGGVVKNLNVVYNDPVQPADPGNRYTYFGGIVGFLNGGTIENCTVSGSICQYNRVGGIVGTALAGTIKDCTVTANITSYPYADNTAYSYASGIVAYVGNSAKAINDKLSITGCTVGAETGTMSVEADYCVAGGIFGWLTAGTELTVSGCTIQNLKVSTSGGDWGVGLLGAYVAQEATGVLNISEITVKGSNEVLHKGVAVSTGFIMTQNNECLLKNVVSKSITVNYNGDTITK